MEDGHHIAELVKRTGKQDLTAMRMLYEYFAREMLTLSFRITNQMQDAEDVIQESFLTSFQRIQDLKTPASYKSWLKRIVVNRSLAYVRRRVSFADLTVEQRIAIPEEEEAWYKDLPFDRIQEAIGRLPDGCRQIFTLYLMEDYKHREIADMLGISISNSKSQYRYALKLLRLDLHKLAL